MKDFDEDEIFKIEYIRHKFAYTAKLFGYRFMDPSPIELLSVLETKSGPAIKDDIYSFKDKHDREVALRFDFTMGLTRYVVSQKSLKLPAKIASFGGVFRYDEPQKGRYRFFHQWNIEIFGKSSIASDAELIEFTSRFFENLNLQNIIIDISHRKLVESYVTNLFQSQDPKLVSEIFRAMDKVQKKRKEDILKEYQEKGIDKDKLEKILEFSGIKGTPDEIEKKLDSSKLASWSELKELYDSLKNRDVQNIRINFGIVRGLDYYSDFVFEAFDTSSDMGALVGGGRYDSLPKAFGREDLGATGVAGGVERIIFSLDKQGKVILERNTAVSVLFATEEMQNPAVKLTAQLRQQGIPANIDLAGKSLKKQMEQASSSKYAIIVGPKEYAEGEIVLRNMNTGKENTIHIKNLLADPESILS